MARRPFIYSRCTDCAVLNVHVYGGTLGKHWAVITDPSACSGSGKPAPEARLQPIVRDEPPQQMPPLQPEDDDAPSLNGASVIARTAESIFVRIPPELAEPIRGGCACDYCNEHPEAVPKWDCLVIPLHPPKVNAHDYVSHCHAPDAQAFRKAKGVK